MCDDIFNTEICNFDEGDCCGPYVDLHFCDLCECKEACGYPNNVGDGYCDDENNLESCNYDGGDCCGPYVVFDFCNDCQCLDPDIIDTAGIPINCIESFIGDGFCDDVNNNPVCSYDNGDCCNANNASLAYCQTCTCLLDTCNDANQTMLLADGTCNVETNSPQCNYDGGDCPITITVSNSTEAMIPVFGPPLLTEDTNTTTLVDDLGCTFVGDGFCDDSNNNPDCNFDGGDCCGENVATDFCSICECINP